MAPGLARHPHPHLHQSSLSGWTHIGLTREQPSPLEPAIRPHQQAAGHQQAAQVSSTLMIYTPAPAPPSQKFTIISLYLQRQAGPTLIQSSAHYLQRRVGADSHTLSEPTCMAGRGRATYGHDGQHRHRHAPGQICIHPRTHTGTPTQLSFTHIHVHRA